MLLAIFFILNFFLQGLVSWQMMTLSYPSLLLFDPYIQTACFAGSWVLFRCLTFIFPKPGPVERLTFSCRELGLTLAVALGAYFLSMQFGESSAHIEAPREGRVGVFLEALLLNGLFAVLSEQLCRHELPAYAPSRFFRILTSVFLFAINANLASGLENFFLALVVGYVVLVLSSRFGPKIAIVGLFAWQTLQTLILNFYGT